MSLKIAEFFQNKGYLNNIDTYQISTADNHTAKGALRLDIDAFFLNGIISLSSSINSLNKSNFSWSFIQAYYSIFFLARAFNGINNYVIVYHNKKPFGIKIQPLERFNKLKGNSHDVVFYQFKTHFHNDTLLINTIENSSPVDWFNSKRNLINYTSNPFTDPTPPLLLYDHKNELRNWIATYINDKSHKYTFDPRHCFIAYPLQLFNRIFNYYSDNNMSNVYLNEEKITFISKNFSDNKGPMAIFISRLKELYES